MKSNYVLIVLLPILILGACSRSQKNSEVLSNNKTKAIIGGTAAEPTDLVTASTVYLLMRDQKQNTWECTGTLISKNLVLTASHCIGGRRGKIEEIFAYFGSVKPVDFNSPGVFPASTWILHPEFQLVTSNRGEIVSSLNDIALIKLEEEVTEPVAPVPVLNEGSSIVVGDNLTLAGYGFVNEIGKIERATGLNHTSVNVAQMEEAFIITDQTQARGACVGDSGGPAYLQTENGLIVVGVTRGPRYPGTDCRHYGEFTNITFFKSFILEQAALLGAAMPEFVDRSQ